MGYEAFAPELHGRKNILRNIYNFSNKNKRDTFFRNLQALFPITLKPKIKFFLFRTKFSILVLYLLKISIFTPLLKTY